MFLKTRIFIYNFFGLPHSSLTTVLIVKISDSIPLMMCVDETYFELRKWFEKRYKPKILKNTIAWPIGQSWSEYEIQGRKLFLDYDEGFGWDLYCKDEDAKEVLEEIYDRFNKEKLKRSTGDSQDLVRLYCGTAYKVLKRPLADEEGLPTERIESTEKNLGFRLPKAMREYYQVAGSAKDLNLAQNRLYTPDQLKEAEGFIWFMEENQSVVHWGIRSLEIIETDPQVWQRNNDSGQWVPLGLSFSKFIKKVWLWQAGLGPGL